MNFTIPKPCHENWETMLPEQKGRFCEVCQKSVLDFTKITDQRILENLNQSEVCGKITLKQLDRINQKESQNPLVPTSYIFKISTFLSFLTTPVLSYSQEKNKIEIVEKKNISETEIPTTDYYIFKSQVIDIDSFPISDAYIEVMDTDIFVFADSEGMFSINIPNWIENPMLIFVEPTNQESYTFPINTLSDKIQLNNHPELELYVMGYFVRKRTFAGKILHTISYPFRKIVQLLD